MINRASISKRIVLLVTLVLFLLGGCTPQSTNSKKTNDTENSQPKRNLEDAVVPPARADNISNGEAPSGKAKYVFLFIGDGMAANHAKLAEQYLTDTASQGLMFTQFPAITSMTTHAANSPVTCSAASGTALATGHKTNNGVIAKDPTLKKNFESIASKVHRAGYKVGVLSSVSIDHATPAVFYAHQDSRNQYYNISLQLSQSNFEFFGGGGFATPRGPTNQSPDAYSIATKAGYQLVRNTDPLKDVSSRKQKVFSIHPKLLNSGAMPWVMDENGARPTLADFTAGAIAHLENDIGFFIMVEGGKIDWACHDNDGAASIHETLAFDDAIKKALSFYHTHKNDTLIVVTADHETGGLKLTQEGASTKLNVGLLQHQQVSLPTLNEQLTGLVKNGESFNDVLEKIARLTGLGDKKKQLSLTREELALLQNAYAEMTAKPSTGANASNTNAYSTKNRTANLAALVVDLLNRKAGVSWSTLGHTGVKVPLYAIGSGAEQFNKPIDNTDVPKIIEKIMGLAN